MTEALRSGIVRTSGMIAGVTMDVKDWLTMLGLSEYAAAFAQNHIDASVLFELGDSDLKELGVSSLGHRKRLLTAIAKEKARSNHMDGAPIDDSAERRQVTVLFADLSNFTALARTLDAEDVKACVEQFTRSVDGIVASYDGTVDKHMGDAVMALFGAPRAHDDDPLRAVRAALDIHDSVAKLTGLAKPLDAHIGIACGEVVAGTMSRLEARDYTVLGGAVNLAARLVAAAGPGQTLMSAEVHAALRGHGTCEDLGERHFKGIDVPIRVWNLRALTSEPSVSARPAFVGRESELAQFRTILTTCLDRGSGQVVHVRGEAGIGKTRLVEEMRKLAEHRGCETHRGLVLDFGTGKGRDPIRSLVHSLLRLTPSSSPAERLRVAQRLGEDGVVDATKFPFLNDLLDLPQTGEARTLYDAMDNATRNRGKRDVTCAIIAQACRTRAVVLVVEDLHWAEPLVLAHLSAIAAAIGTSRGVVVMTSRAEGDPVDAAWRASCRGTPFFTMDLGPLAKDDALRLAEGYVNTAQRVAAACIERAAGNPLFLEQLLRNAEEGRSESVPASIQSLVLSRMDRLTARDRAAFQAASAIGQRFELALLRHLVRDPDYDAGALVEAALVIPEGEEFLFAHALIRDGAYLSLLKSRRRELHVRAAEWFADRDPTLHAQHLDRADDGRAPASYLRAAAAQRAAYHADTALALAERGLEIARTDTDRHPLLCQKGELQRDLGDVVGSIATFRLAAAEAPDDGALCRAKLGLAEGLRVTEGLSEALELLDQAQAVAERDGLLPELARLHHLRGNICFPLGDIAGCRREHELGLGHAQRTGSAEAEARALGGLGDAAYAEGRMRSAFEYFSRCVAISRRHGFGRIEVANRSMIGFSRIYLNEAREALADGEAAARAAVLVGQPRAELLGENMGVYAHHELGDFEAMAASVERTRRLAMQLGARRFEANCLEMEARLLLHRGQRAQAWRMLRDCLALCQEVGTQFLGPKATSALALAVEDPAECRALLDTAREMLGKGAVGHNHLWFHRDAIEAMLAAGDREGTLRSADDLEHYACAEPLPWATLFAERGRALAVLLDGPCDEAGREALSKVLGDLERAGLRPYMAAVESALADRAPAKP